MYVRDLHGGGPGRWCRKRTSRCLDSIPAWISDLGEVPSPHVEQGRDAPALRLKKKKKREGVPCGSRSHPAFSLNPTRRDLDWWPLGISANDDGDPKSKPQTYSHCGIQETVVAKTKKVVCTEYNCLQGDEVHKPRPEKCGYDRQNFKNTSNILAPLLYTPYIIPSPWGGWGRDLWIGWVSFL